MNLQAKLRGKIGEFFFKFKTKKPMTLKFTFSRNIKDTQKKSLIKIIFSKEKYLSVCFFSLNLF